MLSGTGHSCFFRVHRDAPKLTLYDDGRVIVIVLDGGVGGKSSGVGLQGGIRPVTIDDLRCMHFRAMTRESHDALGIAAASARALASASAVTPTPPPVLPDGTSGRVLMMNSATTLDMLSEYHRPLLNHQEYAESHHYGWGLGFKVQGSGFRV